VNPAFTATGFASKCKVYSQVSRFHLSAKSEASKLTLGPNIKETYKVLETEETPQQ